MFYSKKSSNEEKLEYLVKILEENKVNNNKDSTLFFSIYLIRFGSKVPLVHRQPTSVDLKALIQKYSSGETFKPDYIVVDLFTGKSRNVKKPIASYKFNYTGFYDPKES